MKICINCCQEIKKGIYCQACFKEHRQECLKRSARRLLWLITVVITFFILQKETCQIFSKKKESLKSFLGLFNRNMGGLAEHLKSGIKSKDSFVSSPDYIRDFGNQTEAKSDSIAGLIDEMRNLTSAEGNQANEGID